MIRHVKDRLLHALEVHIEHVHAEHAIKGEDARALSFSSMIGASLGGTHVTAELVLDVLQNVWQSTSRSKRSQKALQGRMPGILAQLLHEALLALGDAVLRHGGFGRSRRCASAVAVLLVIIEVLGGHLAGAIR